MIKLLIAAAIAAAVSGCAAINQAYSAQAASAAMGMRTSQDNVVDTLMFAICAVPYGTVIRKQEFQATARAACLPNYVKEAATDLLPPVAAQK